MAELGVNCAGRAEQSPAAIAALGARWVRCVAYPDANITAWLQGSRAAGLKTLLVLARESIGNDPNRWAGNIATFRSRYGGLVDSWQVGNEPDHVSPSSWTMSQVDLSHLLRVARFQLGPDAYLIGAGLVSGQPDWARGVDWGTVNALACHPYAKDPGTPELDWLLEEYAGLGKPLWVTEYHARTIGMAAALRDDARLTAALAFCYSDSMVPGFGLIEDRKALADFKAAAAGRPPAERHAEFVLGFAEWAARDPALLGQPLENERGGVPGLSFQETDRGFLTAARVDGGWVLTFFEKGTRARYMFSGGRSEQIA